jgi:hypothetical protein
MTMSERPNPAPEPTEDAPLGSPRYLERCFIPWPSPGKPWDGWPMAKFGLRMVFYFGNAHEAPVRRALLSIVEQYWAAAREPIRRYAIAEDKRERYLAPGEAPDLTRLRERIGQPDSDWSIDLSAEREIQYASHWSLAALSVIENGYLVLYFPFSFFEGAPRYALRDLFQRWCSALKVHQAYGGMGFVLPVEVGNQAAALRRIGPYAMRFVALDTDLPTTTKLWCRDGIRCVNWLTAVSERLLEKIGGAEAVWQRAGPTVSSLPYDGGTIFVAGPHPQMGDAEQGVIPREYVALGRALKPLRAAHPSTIFNAPEGYEAPPGYRAPLGWGQAKPHQLANAHYAQRWLARFDGD